MATKPNNLRKIHMLFIFVTSVCVALYSSLAFSFDSTLLAPLPQAIPYLTYTWTGDCVYANMVGTIWAGGNSGSGLYTNPSPNRADSTSPGTIQNTTTTTGTSSTGNWVQTDCPTTSHNGQSNVQTFAVAMYTYNITVADSGVQDWLFVCCPIDIVYP